MNRRIFGFTLVEVMVVVSLIFILSAGLFAYFQQAGEQSRDAQRKADLRELQTAIELYKNEHGRYPAGCNGSINTQDTLDSTDNAWSGEQGTSYACSGGRTDYIRGHEPDIYFAPKFISALPTDPRPGTGDYGYAYTVSDDGTVYKLVARNSVESEIVDTDNEFKSCDVKSGTAALCNNAISSGSTPPNCIDNQPVFQTSYGVWGGYENVAPGSFNEQLNLERRTENIICR